MPLTRCVVVAAFYITSLAGSSYSGIPRLALFSEGLIAIPLGLLKWVTVLWLIYEVNRVLNDWAENRWMFNASKRLWDWRYEIAVVTGGSGGIGAMVVKELLSHGVKVAVLDVEPLSDVFQEDEANLVKFYQCDVTSPAAVHSVAGALRSDHGSPSILINNAGIGTAKTILEISPEQLQTCFGVNLLSHWYLIQEFLPDMIIKQKGHIMSTSSMSAFVAFAGAAEYAATKAGLIALHESLSQEIKHRYKCPQIKTSIVFPTWTKTRLTAGIEDNIRSTRAPMHDAKDVARAMVNQIIAGKSGQLLLGPGLATAVRALPIWLQEIIRDHMAHVVTGNATTAVKAPAIAEIRQPENAP